MMWWLLIPAAALMAVLLWQADRGMRVDSGWVSRWACPTCDQVPGGLLQFPIVCRHCGAVNGRYGWNHTVGRWRYDGWRKLRWEPRE